MCNGVALNDSSAVGPQGMRRFEKLYKQPEEASGPMCEWKSFLRTNAAISHHCAPLYAFVCVIQIIQRLFR
ncbi:unnamed protein product [Toxocara canis]|uniref:Transmembrane protein n=1 Tax=Toxocara canis TaxID=6265 RepID=A0A183UJ32_TOXCA|nr:unnamed protein product [Toxocara canis]